MGVFRKNTFPLTLSLACLATSAWANRAVVHREVLSTCYIVSQPEWHESLVGRLGDTHDQNNPCNDGYFSAQSLSYAYQTQTQVLLIIENENAPATTQTVTETAPAWENYPQQESCESRKDFAREAKEFFDSFVKYQLQPLCPGQTLAPEGSQKN